MTFSAWWNEIYKINIILRLDATGGRGSKTIPRFIGFQEKRAPGFSLHSVQFTVFGDAVRCSPRIIGKCFSYLERLFFCQWGDSRPSLGGSHFRPLLTSGMRRPSSFFFSSAVNVTLSPTPSRTMPLHVPGCGSATHSSAVPRTLPPPSSPWLSLRGGRVVLISIAWYDACRLCRRRVRRRSVSAEGSSREPRLASRDSPLGREKTPVRGLRPTLRAEKDFVSFFVPARECKAFRSPFFFCSFQRIQSWQAYGVRKLEASALHAYFILGQNGRRSLAVMRKHIFERQQRQRELLCVLPVKLTNFLWSAGSEYEISDWNIFARTYQRNV